MQTQVGRATRVASTEDMIHMGRRNPVAVSPGGYGDPKSWIDL
jgi:hypothetical protein